MTKAVTAVSENPVITLGTLHFKEANEQVHDALDIQDTVVLKDVYAQRYLGCAMPTGKTLLIHGTPGNDMASYMDGGRIEVFGNAQDQVGNTMNDGKIIVHGRCGDAAGYAMRGGQIFIRDDCGWRVGIHMKQYQQKCPAVVIGGNAGNFLGEYLAGGIIVLMGYAGEYLGTGMHGGIIYLAHRLDDKDVMAGLVQEQVDDTDCRILKNLLGEYNHHFASDMGESVPATGKGYWKLRPESSRPYAAMYAN